MTRVKPVQLWYILETQSTKIHAQERRHPQSSLPRLTVREFLGDVLLTASAHQEWAKAALRPPSMGGDLAHQGWQCPHQAIAIAAIASCLAAWALALAATMNCLSLSLALVAAATIRSLPESQTATVAFTGRKSRRMSGRHPP